MRSGTTTPDTTTSDTTTSDTTTPQRPAGDATGTATSTPRAARVRRDAARSLHWMRAIAGHPANRGARSTAVRRAARWHWRTRRGLSERAEVTVDGRTRIVCRPDQFSAVWTLYNGVHEWEEIQFCLRYLRAGDHFVDVGANVGVFSTLIGTRLPGVRITAIEPYEPVAAELRLNLVLNELEIELVPEAVGAAAGEAAFEVHERSVLNRLAPPTDGAGAHTTMAVAVTTLDQVVEGTRPSLVKIDVEGAELDVMRGARGVLAHDAPVLLFEHCGHGTTFGVTPADVRSFLDDIGYRLYLLDGKLTPWQVDEPPPTLNVVATNDIDAVRQRLAGPGGAPFSAPVRVEVDYSPNGGSP